MDEHFSLVSDELEEWIYGKWHLDMSEYDLENLSNNQNYENPEEDAIHAQS